MRPEMSTEKDRETKEGKDAVQVWLLRSAVATGFRTVRPRSRGEDVVKGAKRGVRRARR